MRAQRRLVALDQAVVRRLDMDKTQGIEQLFATGMSIRQIARTLGINRKTADRHLATFGRGHGCRSEHRGSARKINPERFIPLFLYFIPLREGEVLSPHLHRPLGRVDRSDGRGIGRVPSPLVPRDPPSGRVKF
jgi:hypothetical protein